MKEKSINLKSYDGCELEGTLLKAGKEIGALDYLA